MNHDMDTFSIFKRERERETWLPCIDGFKPKLQRSYLPMEKKSSKSKESIWYGRVPCGKEKISKFNRPNKTKNKNYKIRY